MWRLRDAIFSFSFLFFVLSVNYSFTTMMSQISAIAKI